MDYYDDLLNVYAYLQAREKQDAAQALDAARETARLAQVYQSMDDKADNLLSEMDALLARAYALAENRKVDVSDISYQKPKASAASSAPTPPDTKIKLPADFDFQKDFQRLVSEAHAAGFVNVHPEEILTAEEIAHAQEFADALDDSFCQATRLKKKDILILTVAVAMRVILFCLDSAREQAKPEGAYSLDTAPAAEPTLGASLREALERGDALADRIAGEAAPRILSPEEIWSQSDFFSIQAPGIFRSRDIMARKPIIGWLFGIVNILTGTVTTTRLKSYRVVYEQTLPRVGKPVSTVRGVIKPVVNNFFSCKDSVISAVMQEARLQGFSRLDSASLSGLFTRATILEDKISRAENMASSALNALNVQWLDCVGDIALSGFLNTVVASIHALTYDRSDGNLNTFSVRTNRIVMYSNAIAAMINSVPGLISEDFTKLDYAGMITALFTAFQSHRFWVEVKARFIESAYLKELTREMEKVDQYFEFIP